MKKGQQTVAAGGIGCAQEVTKASEDIVYDCLH